MFNQWLNSSPFRIQQRNIPACELVCLKIKIRQTEMVQEFLQFIFFEKIWNRLSITPRIIGNNLPQNFVIVLPGSKKIPLLPSSTGMTIYALIYSIEIKMIV